MVIIALGAVKLAQVAAYNIKKDNKRHEIITKVSGSPGQREWWDEGGGASEKRSDSSQNPSGDSSSSGRIGAWSRNPAPLQETQRTENLNSRSTPNLPVEKNSVRGIDTTIAAPVVPLEPVSNPPSQESSIRTAASTPSSTNSSQPGNDWDEPAPTPTSASKYTGPSASLPPKKDEQPNDLAFERADVSQSAFANVSTAKRYHRRGPSRPSISSSAADQIGFEISSSRRIHATEVTPAKNGPLEDTATPGTSQSALPGRAVKAKYSKQRKACAPSRNVPAGSSDVLHPKDTRTGVTNNTEQGKIAVQSSLASAGSMKRPARIVKQRMTENASAAAPKVSVNPPMRRGPQPSLSPAISSNAIPRESSSNIAAPGSLKKRIYRPDSSQL